MDISKLHKTTYLYLLLAFILLGNSAQAQYDGGEKHLDIAINTPSLAMTVGAILRTNRMSGLSVEKVESFRTRSFSGIDKWSVQQFNPNLERTSDFILAGTALLPGIFLAFEEGRNDAANAMRVYQQTALLSFAVSSFSKAYTAQPRPYVFNPEVSLETATQKEARLGFFSRHTTLAASLSFMTAQFIQVYSNRKGLKIIVWIAAATLPGVVGYLQLKSGDHFFRDVATGYAVGSVIGIGVPLLHKR